MEPPFTQSTYCHDEMDPPPQDNQTPKAVTSGWTTENDAPPGAPSATTETSLPSTRFTIRIPGPMTYANVLKRTYGQAMSTDGEGTEDPHEGKPGPGEQGEPKPNPGPIKGFRNHKVLENLDPLVRKAWKEQANQALFVHYLDAGYSQNIAQNVHVMVEDLQSKHPRLAVGKEYD